MSSIHNFIVNILIIKIKTPLFLNHFHHIVLFIIRLLHGTIREAEPVRKVQRILESFREPDHQRPVHRLHGTRHQGHEETLARAA